MSRTKQLPEAARQVVYFAGSTPENLAALRNAVNEADYWYLCQDEEEEEEEEGG